MNPTVIILSVLSVIAMVVWFLVLKPSEKKPVMCKWGRWLPCHSDGKQRRYAVVSDQGTFECGTYQKVDTRDCSNNICDTSLIPYCVCKRYDLDGKCVESDTVFGRCQAPNVSPDAYTVGYCDSETRCKWGPWLACDSSDNKQSRYEITASLDDPNAFVCGNTRRVETRTCPAIMCNRALVDYCACTAYNMSGNCVSRKTVNSACLLADTDQYTPGSCNTGF